MKLLAIIKNTIFVLALLVGSITAYAATPKSYIYDTQEENGLIVSKTVYLQDNNQLNRQIKYNFSYNEEGKVIEKKAYKWSKKGEDWMPFYLITYSYNEAEEEIHSIYGMWNEKTKDYSLNVQNLNTSISDYEEIFS